MKILVVSAHPDDETIGMGGTLKKLSGGNEIKILFLSDGITSRRASGYKNAPKYHVTKNELNKMKKNMGERKKHTKEALKILGVKDLKFLDLPNNELDTISLLKIVKEIEWEIYKYKYDVIFTHHFNDLNIDHRIAFEATVTAARPLPENPVSSIFSFEAISSTDWNKPYSFKPNLFIDISREIKDKLRAMSEYKKELRKFPHPRSVKAIEAAAIRWGSLYGYNAAEAFETIYTKKSDPCSLI